MDSFTSYILRQAYQRAARLGDRLAKIDKAVDWEAFRPIIRAMYTNNTTLGGRPNTDEVLMMKLLVLQQWYGLSDMELERQAAYRLDFQNFLGWPERPPDYSTVWQFRERLAATMTDAVLWGELSRQLDEAGLKVRKGVAQDASFIEADPGQSSSKPSARAIKGVTVENVLEKISNTVHKRPMPPSPPKTQSSMRAQ